MEKNGQLLIGMMLGVLVFLGVGVSSAGAADITTGLNLYYSLNGNANDLSGNGNNGTVNGASLTSDKFGNAKSAYIFNGSSNYIDTNYRQTNVSQYTISAWIKTKSSTIEIIQNRGPQLQRGMSLTLLLSDGKAVFALNSDNILIGASSVATVNDNSWHHLVGVFNSSSGSVANANQFKLYVDNVDVSSPYTLGTAPTAPFTGVGTTKIGYDEPNQAYYQGQLSDVRIYNRALSASDVVALYYDNNVVTTSKVFMGGNGDFFYVNTSGTTLYGGWGDNKVTIANGISGINIDQNVGIINLPSTLASYTFMQSGNNIKIYDSTGTTMIVRAIVQGDVDGTVLNFSNGTASVFLTGGVMTLGGAILGNTAPTSLVPILN